MNGVQRIMDWVIDAHMWLKTLMPQYRSIFAVYALSNAHKAALRAGLTGQPVGLLPKLLRSALRKNVVVIYVVAG